MIKVNPIGSLYTFEEKIQYTYGMKEHDPHAWLCQLTF